MFFYVLPSYRWFLMIDRYIVHKFHSFSSHFVPVYFQVAFVTVGKDRYQLEIPESVQKKVPRDYEVMSSRKVYSWTTNHVYVPADHSFSIYDFFFSICSCDCDVV